MLVEWLQPLMAWFGIGSFIELCAVVIIILLVIKD